MPTKEQHKRKFRKSGNFIQLLKVSLMTAILDSHRLKIYIYIFKMKYSYIFKK